MTSRADVTIGRHGAPISMGMKGALTDDVSTPSNSGMSTGSRDVEDANDDTGRVESKDGDSKTIRSKLDEWMLRLSPTRKLMFQISHLLL